MFFNHKTKKLSGGLREISPERKVFLERQVALGVMESTAHPSQEEIDAVLKLQSGCAFNENWKVILKNRGLRD